jgi:hypothetical protein
MRRNPNDPIALQVRMTEGLRRKLATAAEKNGRSLNSEIVWRLGQTFDAEGGKPLEEAHQLKGFIEAMAANPVIMKTVAEQLAQNPAFRELVKSERGRR